MTPKRRRIAWILVWIVLGAFLVVRMGGRDRGVITDHVEFGRRLLAGDDLYAPYLDVDDRGRAKPLHPPYPPSFGLLTAPFSLLPERGARYAWVTLQVLALWLIGLRLRDLLRDAYPDLAPRTQVLFAATAALGVRFVLRDTHGGGGNLFNLALALQSLHLAARGSPKTAGLLLGFSLATKPTQAMFVLVLWLLRHRAAAAWTLVATGAFVALTIVIHRGIEHWPYWLSGTLAYASQQDLFADPKNGFPPFTWMNQSLRCMVARFFGEVLPEFADLVPGFFAGFGLDAATSSWIARGLGVALLGTTVAVAWRTRERAAARLPVVAAFLALSLLLSPISWKAHHVALLPAFLTIVVGVFRGDVASRAFVVAFVLLVLPGGDLLGRGLDETQNSLYVVTFGTIAAWALCLRAATTLPADAVPR